MKWMFLIAFLFVLALPGIVSADCSIGANPLNMNVEGIPGDTVSVFWNLYNIHGDRITHVTLTAIETSPGWEYSFSPELHDQAYLVTGQEEIIQENVGLDPTDVVLEIPSDPPEGMDYVKHPNEDGYIPIRPIEIRLEIPQDAELYKDHKFVVEAVGNCFTGPGMVIPGISTKLNLNIKTVSGEAFSEQRIDNPTPELINEPEIQEPAELNNDGFTGFIVSNAGFIGIIAVLIILLLYFGVFRKK